MKKSWKYLSAEGYICTIESDAEKGTINIFDQNNAIIFSEKNLSKKVLETVEKHYTLPEESEKPKDHKSIQDTMMYV